MTNPVPSISAGTNKEQVATVNATTLIMSKECDCMNWILWKLRYLRYEFIYLLGGVPRNHINTVHYRNIGSIVADIQQKIKDANK